MNYDKVNLGAALTGAGGDSLRAAFQKVNDNYDLTVEVDWANILSKPLTFPPEAHTHPASEVTAGTFNGNYLFDGNIQLDGELHLPAAGGASGPGVIRLGGNEHRISEYLGGMVLYPNRTGGSFRVRSHEAATGFRTDFMIDAAGDANLYGDLDVDGTLNSGDVRLPSNRSVRVGDNPFVEMAVDDANTRYQLGVVGGTGYTGYVLEIGRSGVDTYVLGEDLNLNGSNNDDTSLWLRRFSGHSWRIRNGGGSLSFFGGDNAASLERATFNTDGHLNLSNDLNVGGLTRLKGLRLTGSGVDRSIAADTDNEYTRMFGGISGSGAGFILYGGSHGTVPDEGRLRTGTTARFSWDTGGVYVNTFPSTQNSANVHRSVDGRLEAASSTRRIKRNIEDADLSASWGVINGVRPVWFRAAEGRGNPAHSFWGFIAEEVAEVDPRLTWFGYMPEDWETDDGRPLDIGDLGDRPKPGAELQPMGVNYDKFVVHLVNIAKDQAREIQQLREDVDRLLTASEPTKEATK